MRFLVKMKFHRGFSIASDNSLAGGRRPGLIHSDTLFSAIANQWAKIRATVSLSDLILKMIENAPPFILSSAFPYWAEKCYLPTPFGMSNVYRTIAKDIPYIALSDLLSLKKGQNESLKQYAYLDPTSALLHHWSSPRVTLDRISAASNIYKINGVSIISGGGLYFIVEIIDKNILDSLITCIKLLGNAGVGKNRAIGYGHFNASFEEISTHPQWSELFQKNFKGEDKALNLSLCCPHPDRAEAKEAYSYGLISRGGWILSSSTVRQYKRRECIMFSEGSIFKSPIAGYFANVTPSIFLDEHQVYRYGFAMMVAGRW